MYIYKYTGIPDRFDWVYSKTELGGEPYGSRESGNARWKTYRRTAQQTVQTVGSGPPPPPL